MGERYWHEDNRVKQHFYGLLDVSTAVEKESLRVTLWGKNILNKRQLGYYFESAGRSLGKPVKPFTTGVTIDYSF